MRPNANSSRANTALGTLDDDPVLGMAPPLPVGTVVGTTPPLPVRTVVVVCATAVVVVVPLMVVVVVAPGTVVVAPDTVVVAPDTVVVVGAWVVVVALESVAAKVQVNAVGFPDTVTKPCQNDFVSPDNVQATPTLYTPAGTPPGTNVKALKLYV